MYYCKKKVGYLRLGTLRSDTSTQTLIFLIFLCVIFRFIWRLMLVKKF